jgi:hypothetical protein
MWVREQINKQTSSCLLRVEVFMSWKGTMQIAQQGHDRNSQVICNTLSNSAPQSKGKKQSSNIKSSNLNSYMYLITPIPYSRATTIQKQTTNAFQKSVDFRHSIRPECP